MRLTQETLTLINKGGKANIIKAEMIKANDKHPGTIQRWIDNNDEILTSAKNLSIICEQLGLTQEQILEEENTTANTAELNINRAEIEAIATKTKFMS